MKKNKERYQTEKTKRLNKINKKLSVKSNTIFWLTAYSTSLVTTIIMKGILNTSNLLTIGISAVLVGVIGSLINKKFKGNYQENEKLIDYLNIQEEFETLDEKEQDKVKQLAKDKELVDAVQYISDLSFNEERIALLKDVVLNPSIMQFVNKTDDKDCFEKITEYNFNKEQLEKETEKAFEIGTKSKQLVKEMKATVNEFEDLLRNN